MHNNVKTNEYEAAQAKAQAACGSTSTVSSGQTYPYVRVCPTCGTCPTCGATKHLPYWQPQIY